MFYYHTKVTFMVMLTANTVSITFAYVWQRYRPSSICQLLVPGLKNYKQK